MASNATGGTLTWILDADDKKLNASLTKAQTGAKQTATELTKAGAAGQKAASNIGTSFMTSLTGVQSGIGKVTGAMQNFALKAVGVGAAIGGIALVGLKSAASLEQIETNLFAISGSAEFATEGLAKLRKISMDTAGFSVGGLSSVTLGLKNIYGSAEEAIKQTEVLARVISATGGSEQDLGGVVNALSMIAVSGKAGSRQIKALFQASPLFSEIAAKAGITAEALEKSADPLKMLTNAFGEAAKEGGMLQAAIDAQNNTLKDAWDDATENFQLSFGTWIRTSGLVELVKEELAKFQIWLNANGPSIAEKIKEGFEWLMDNKGVIIEAVKSFAKIWVGLKITSFILSVVKGVDTILKFAKILGIAKKASLIFMGVIGLIAAVVVVWSHNINMMIEHAEDLKDAWKDWSEFVVRITDGVVDAITDFFQEIGAGFSILGEMITGAFDTAVQAIGQFFSGVKNTVLGIGAEIVALKDKIVQGVVNVATWLFQAGVNLIVGFINGIVSYFITIVFTLQSLQQAVIDFFVGAIMWLWQAGVNLIQGLINGILSMPGAIWSAIKSAADTIGNFFSGAANWLYDTGKAIVQGLINGIKDMAGAAKDTVSNIGSGITSKFKSILGIGSPSKVFTGFGENIVQGLKQGISTGVGSIQANVTGMANATTEAPLATGNIPLATNSATNNSTVTIGTINIAKEVDGERWLQRLNRNTELAGQGMVGATNG